MTRITGVLSPVVTPFSDDLSPDAERFVRHCRWLVANNVGLAVFGTNSEANSLSVGERMELLEKLVEGGIDPARMMPGTGCCALTDSVRLTSHAVKLGCAGVLMLPPFYYKGVSDEGLFRNFAEIVERVGDARLQDLSLSHPAGVAGADHAEPDRAAAEGVSAEHRRREGLLRRLEQHEGDAGPVRFERFRRVRRQRDIPARQHAQRRQGLHQRDGERESSRDSRPLRAVEDATARMRCRSAWTRSEARSRSIPMIPALKAAVAHWGSDPGWARVRPPLVELSAEQSSALIADLKQRDFSMPGL